MHLSDCALLCAAVLCAQVSAHRKSSFASGIVDVIKPKYAMLVVDAPPCLSKQACAFWLQQKFNPSPELLSMRTLADGKKGNVTVVQNAKLTWESDAAWDTEKYKKMMDKHFADMDKLDTEETEHKPPATPQTAFVYSTRNRKRVHDATM